jgi:methylenetetrahydrofolate reductase (NADPH)
MREHLYGTILPDGLIARLEGAQDQAAEGARICLDLMAELADTPGVAGVHLMAPRNVSALAGLIAEWRKRGAARRRA